MEGVMGIQLNTSCHVGFPDNISLISCHFFDLTVHLVMTPQVRTLLPCLQSLRDIALMF